MQIDPQLPFTETQIRILKTLRDGERHKPEELVQCMPDPTRFAAKNNMQNQLSDIRKILMMRREAIVCEYWQRQRFYRWVRLLPPVPAANGSNGKVEGSSS